MTIFVYQNFGIQVDEILSTSQNHSRLEQIDIVNDVSIGNTSVVLIHDEMHDTDVNIDAPNDDALEAITAHTLSIPIVIPKTVSFRKFYHLVGIDWIVEQR